jgi:sulfide:quinone oxidoreductase
VRTRVVILGAGFGGLELSSRLSAELPAQVDVTLIDQSDSFVFGFSKLDVMFGRRTMDEVRISYRNIAKPGVTFRQESVLSIDPERKRVVTNAGVRDADVLVVALGADLAPGATPGLEECGHEFYSPDGAARVRDLLPSFPGGNVVIGVLVDRAAKVAHLKDGNEVPFDLFLAVPVHCAPPAVVASGLTEDGWIPVDPATFATRFPDVYAVGDVTSAPVPRAGVFAEGEASTVADVLTARIAGAPPPAPYAGEMTCYVEMGNGTVGTINANFLSGPAPTASFTPPSAEAADDKRRFAASRRDRWFGPAC